MKNKEVVVRISDGLGNQLFQLACGIQLAKKTGRELVLDLNEFFISKFFPIPAHLRRKYQLAAFGIPYRPIRGTRKFFYLMMWVLRKKAFAIFRLMLRICDIRWVDVERRDVLDASMMAYDDFNRSRRIFMSGIHCHLPLMPPRDEVRKLLTFPPLADRFTPVGERIRQAGDHSVSVHVRRTDYALFGICLAPSYYSRAIDAVRARCPDAKLFVFSDDIAWCRANLPELAGCEYVEGDWDAPWNDMHLMSLCHHHIIANSTFSWWGAFLSEPGGMTIYPNPWWIASPIQATMIPSEWVAIKSRD